MTELEKIRFEHTVLEGLMYLATDGEASHLPSIWEFITSEIVGATYEYVLGKEFKDTWSEYRHFMSENWPDVVNRRLNVLNGKRVRNRINPALADAIRGWTKLDWSHDHGESWWDNDVRFYFLFGGHIHMQSTFALTVPQAREIEKDLESLDADTLNHLKNIAEIMKKYVRADLAHIEEHYQW